MGLFKVIRGLSRHPFGDPVRAFLNFGVWQIRSRLSDEVVVPWIKGTSLIVRRGMTGATGNIYFGLHEYPEMALVAHVLRPGDLFADVGANVGVYTVLASGVCRADTVSFEPAPAALDALTANVTRNGLDKRTRIVAAAVGAAPGEVEFTIGHDTLNRVWTGEGDHETRKVPVVTLDSALPTAPVMLKIDVEGYEAEAFAGASRVLADPNLRIVITELCTPAIMALFEKAGFENVYYDPRARRLTGANPGLDQSNAIMVRDRPWIDTRLTSAPDLRVMGKSL